MSYMGESFEKARQTSAAAGSCSPEITYPLRVRALIIVGGSAALWCLILAAWFR